MTQLTSTQKGAFMAAGLVLAAAGGAQAASTDAGRAAVLQAVVNCRAVSDTAARLACYDAAAARLDEAEAKGEVVVMDREQTRQARREAFGFTLPSLAIFERGDSEKMDRVTFKVARATEANDGTWTIELDAGAVWRQTDTERLSRRPKPGSTVEVRSASMGSYFMNVDGQRAIRVRREK
jgi:hypothetical protein